MQKNSFDCHEKGLRLLVVAAITYGAMKASVFGWNIFSPSLAHERKHEAVLEQNLHRHVLRLAAKIGNRNVYQYENLCLAADYIAAVFASYGYPVSYQEYTVEGKQVRNIIATKQGRQRGDEIIVVGAHYDSCYNPGADDNASAVAGVLELARLMRTRESARTIQFVAFVNEEPPFFTTEQMGSRVFTRRSRKNGDNIKAAVILEMIGFYSEAPNSQRYPPFFGMFYPNKGNFIAVVGNFGSYALVRKVTSAFGRDSGVPVQGTATFDWLPGIYFSDHWSFWKEGWPAVMITDTSFLRNKNYHLQSDTPDTLDYSVMASVVEGLQRAVSSLSD